MMEIKHEYESHTFVYTEFRLVNHHDEDYLKSHTDTDISVIIDISVYKNDEVIGLIKFMLNMKYGSTSARYHYTHMYGDATREQKVMIGNYMDTHIPRILSKHCLIVISSDHIRSVIDE